MNRLFPIAILSLVTVCEVNAQEQSRYLYDFQTKRSYAALYKPVGNLTGLFGSSISAEIGMFLASDGRGTPILGYALQSKFKLADQASFSFGPALINAQNEKPRLAILAGVSFRF